MYGANGTCAAARVWTEHSLFVKVLSSLDYRSALRIGSRGISQSRVILIGYYLALASIGFFY